MTPAPHQPIAREVVLVTGISGSGKSVALHALEDAGYFCVDNLPPELLRDVLRLHADRGDTPLAIAVDVRSQDSLPRLLPLIEELRRDGVGVRSVFLDASNDALVRRFSETRRPHPLSKVAADGELHRDLVQSIDCERGLLGDLREVSLVVDTSQLRPPQLRAWIRELLAAPARRLTLVFLSFAFKRGVPLDADYVFDVRVLPNPHYVRELRPLTGRDAPVAAFLEAQPDVLDMRQQIAGFLRRWLPAFEVDQRSYLTVAIGCTGGQHRSVYLAQTLSAEFANDAVTLVRHRELQGGTPG